jgi:hypothetical protein
LNKFHEVQLLLDRADEHLKWLRDWVVHPDADLIPANEGIYVVQTSFDVATAKIRIVIGEYASCLRNSLNYLTCAVADQDSSRVGKRVQLPIVSDPKDWPRNRDIQLEGVDPQHFAFFERLQPFNASQPSWLALLRDLSDWYRHKGLIKVEKVFQRPRAPSMPTRTVRYGRATMKVYPEITFGVTLENGLPVIETLEKLKVRTAETIEEFKSPLAEYISLNIEEFL